MTNLRESIQALHMRLLFGDPKEGHMEFKLYGKRAEGQDRRGVENVHCNLRWVFTTTEATELKASGYVGKEAFRDGVPMPYYQLRSVLSWCLQNWEQGRLVRYDSNSVGQSGGYHLPRFRDWGRRLVVRIANEVFQDGTRELIDGNIVINLTLPPPKNTDPKLPHTTLTMHCELQHVRALMLACTYVPSTQQIAASVMTNDPARMYAVAELIETMDSDTRFRSVVRTMLELQDTDPRVLRVLHELVGLVGCGGEAAFTIVDAAVAALRPKVEPKPDPVSNEMRATFADAVQVRQADRERRATSQGSGPVVEHVRPGSGTSGTTAGDKDEVPAGTFRH